MLYKDDAGTSDNMHEETGEVLFRRFREGMDAFDLIVSLYEDELSRYIYGIIKDSHETKHLTIEAFGQLATSGKKFAGKSTLKTYLFTIGKNLALRHMKARQKHDHISYDEIAEALCDDNETPHGYLEREESKQQLHEAMSELTEDHRTVLRLLYFDGLSYREAGREMGKSEKQISLLAYRAKVALKKRLERNDME